MIVVNLFGAPGAGKSTGAAYIFSQLKLKYNINAELVTEFAKDKVWEDNAKALDNQAYVFGEQSYRISKMDRKVDIVVTDSPLLLSKLYNSSSILGESFNETVVKVFNSYTNMNFFINRVKKYNPAGRLQTEEESDKLSTKLFKELQELSVPFEMINGDLEGYNKIIDEIIAYKSMCNSDNRGKKEEAKETNKPSPSTIKVIALFGPSSSGKDTIKKRIIETYPQFHNVINTTSRPIRPGEENHINYHFVSTEDFTSMVISNKLAEGAVFNNWGYGTEYSAFDSKRINIGVFSIAGIECLIDNPQYNIFPIFIDTSDIVRLSRSLRRDPEHCEEICRRFLADKKDFLTENIPFDYSIVNGDRPVEEIVSDIINIQLVNFPMT